MPRRFSVKVAGKERTVELEDGEAGAISRVVVDGVERALDVWQAEPGVWVLRQGSGAQTVAQVDGQAPKLTVEIRGPGGDPVTVAAEVADVRAVRAATLARGAGAAATGTVVVRSTIPGRVVKLLVRVGDHVTAGQPTVVLEAMKMENELRAPRAGTVRDVRCAEGAAVEAGQDLILIG